ncbi:sulfatase-like hydrolase/transferase [bacterium]|nr:sulfatase-like hydrolase/transferase [bacterium]
MPLPRPHRETRTALLVLVLLCLAGCQGDGDREPVPPDGARPNLLVITLDTARADHLGCYGYPGARTPHIDRLARGGVLFDQAITAAPLTVPAHASLFTGLRPPAHGARTNESTLTDETITTLAEVLRDAGYATRAWVGAEVVRRWSGLAQGFDAYADDFSGDRRAGSGKYVEKPAAEVVGAAMTGLRRVPEPFFAWVHLFDPHAPYAPPEDHAAPSGHAYDGEIAYADHWLGELFASLEASGRRERTVIAFLSDHGEALGQHGEHTHGIFLYDATLHIPLILNGPGLGEPGRRVAEQVRIIDVMPTLLDLAGVPAPDGLHGVDLSPLWRGGKLDALPAYSETLHPWTTMGWSPLYALRDEGWKAIEAPRPELYDLARDPGERSDLADDEGKRRDRMLARIAGLRAADAGRARGDDAVLDDERRAALESLGYVTSSRSGEVPEVAAHLFDPKDGRQVLESYQHGHALLTRGDPAGAIEVLRPVFERHPGATQLGGALAEGYLALRRYDDARRVYEQILEWDAHDTKLLINLASIHLMAGDTDQGVLYLERALEVDPHHVAALINLAETYRAARDDTARARVYYERFLEAAPTDADAPRVRRILESWGR